MTFEIISILLTVILGIVSYTHPVNESETSHKRRRLLVVIVGSILLMCQIFLVIKKKGDDERNESKIKALTNKVDSLYLKGLETTSLITGGDSYPELFFEPDMCKRTKFNFFVQNKGRFPLEAVSFQLMDVDAGLVGCAKKDSHLIKKAYLFIRNFGSMASEAGTTVNDLCCIPAIDELQERNFIASIGTKYSKFEELIKLREKDGKVFFATRLINQDAKKVIADSFYTGFLSSNEDKIAIKWITTHQYTLLLNDCFKKYK
jgi:hypothetical protein